MNIYTSGNTDAGGLKSIFPFLANLPATILALRLNKMAMMLHGY